MAIVPTSHFVDAGQPVTFSAAVEDEPSGETVEYEWQLNGAPVAGGDGDKYTIDGARAEHAGYYQVVATAGTERASSDGALLALRAGAPEWDDAFAGGTAAALVAAAVLLMSPLIVALYRLVDDDVATNWPNLIALELVVFGALALAAATYATLLDVRGRFRRPRIVTAQPRGPAARGAGGAITAIAQAVPGMLTAFGKLSGIAALLAVAALLFLAGTLLAWKALPDDGGTTRTDATNTALTTEP